MKNGSVVLNGRVELPDGVEVTVDLTPVKTPVLLTELLKNVIERGTGLPSDSQSATILWT